jgi:hypothetical protein
MGKRGPTKRTTVEPAAKLAHELVPVPEAPAETKPDWIATVLDEQGPLNAFSPAVFNLVCERIANGESLLQISSEPGMPSRATLHRWCHKPAYRDEYLTAVQLRTDGLLEETIDIIDDKKEIVTETVTEHEDGTKSISRAISKDALAYAESRMRARYVAIAKMLPRKWGKDGHGYGEPAPAVEAPPNGDKAKNMGNVVVLDQHPLREQIMGWQRLADEARAKK